MKNYKIYLCDNENYKDAEVRSLMYATDENGNAEDGYTITVTIFRNGEELTSGTFEKNDSIILTVEYQISEEKILTETKKDITVW